MATKQEGCCAAAVGIDLGTTYSCVAVWSEQQSRVEIIHNDQGNNTTPSFVSFTEYRRLIGDAAQIQATINPENTVFDAKRLIGRNFSDPVVQNDIMLWPFKVIASVNDKPMIAVKYKGQEKYLYAEEISSMILMKMRQIAEAYLKSSVKNAVITVPANFNDSQRKATMDAGAIAGLNVLRIINEPIATAIAYGLDKYCGGERNIFVFDLGGGTFDVSLLTVKDGIFQVKSTAGNPHLGGADMDNRMLNYFVHEFKRKNKVDISGNPKALRRLRTACEKAKRTLSVSAFATVEVDYLFDGIDFFSSITRAKFEEINMDLFNECMETIERCLVNAKMDKNSVDDVVLVGGSSRIPKVQQLLRDFFKGKNLCMSIHPDEAVAYGAAVLAALSSEGVKNVPNMVVPIDVVSFSLCVCTSGDTVSEVIPRNTTIPVEKTGQYVVNKASSVFFNIYYDNNLPPGVSTLFGIPLAPRDLLLDLCFAVDKNGIFTVYAKKEYSTGNMYEEITVANNKLTTEDIEKLTKEAENDRIEDLIKSAIDVCLHKIINVLQKETINSKLSSKEKEKINSAMTMTINSCYEKPYELTVLENHLKELQGMLKTFYSNKE